MADTIKDKLLGSMGPWAIVIMIGLVSWFGKEAYYDIKSDIAILTEKVGRLESLVAAGSKSDEWTLANIKEIEEDIDKIEDDVEELQKE